MIYTARKKANKEYRIKWSLAGVSVLFQHCALFNLYKSDLPTVSLRPENLFVQTTPDIGSIRNNKTEITEAALTEQGPHIYSPGVL